MTEKEKNCRKLVREKELLEHDMYIITSLLLLRHYYHCLLSFRKYHKVLKGIAPIQFDKTSTDTHVEGCILNSNSAKLCFVFGVHFNEGREVSKVLTGMTE